VAEKRKSVICRVIAVFCFIVMLLSAAGEGAFIILGSFGGPAPLPTAEIVFHWAWFGLFCFTLLYFRLPRTTLVVASMYFVFSSVVVWKYFGSDHSLGWFLYQHCLELVFLVFAFVGYFFGLKGEIAEKVRGSSAARQWLKVQKRLL